LCARRVGLPAAEARFVRRLASVTGNLHAGIEMRATIARIVLGLFAAGAVVLGILALFGLKPVGDRLTTILVAVGAIGCGAAVLRFVFGGEPSN